MEPRRIYDYRSPHCQPHRTAASDPGYRSLRAFLLVKRQGAMDHLRKPWPHETHARERSRNRRERSDVPHSARPMSLFRIGQSQAKANPGKINMAAVGVGSATHVSGELFKILAGVDLVTVQYRDPGPAHTDLITG